MSRDDGSLISWFKSAWGIRRIEAVEFYTRTMWSVVSITAIYLLMVCPACLKNRMLFDASLGFIALAAISALLVLAGINTSWELSNPESFNRFMDANYSGDHKRWSWLYGRFYTPPMRLECRIITTAVLAEAVLIVVSLIRLNFTENPGISGYIAVVSGLTALSIGAIGWYRMIIVERGYLIIPDDWPE